MEWASVTGDPRFFARTGPHSLAAVAEAARGEAPPRRVRYTGIAPLQSAGPEEVSFLDNKRYLPALADTQAGAVIIHPDLAGQVPEGCVAITTPEPYEGWARVAALFHPEPPAVPGIHPAAVVDPSATIDPSAEIGPLAVIGARAEIGARCRIGALAVIGDGVVVGADCRIGPQVSVSYALLGARVCLYAGARVGQDGFGFAITGEGLLTVPQLGRVILGDDVQVGANSTIDRGSAQDTVIGAGSRLDNLVQIGHNVRLGRCCVVVAQAGISGSTELEDFVVVAAQAGLTGHLRIGRQARIGAQAGVMADVPPGQDVVGSPSQPVKAFFRQVAILRRMDRDRSKARSARGAAESEAGTD
ncbi:MAG: UDP-3-O-(3-hydroxymyristoyl)glucosamine N-acyltransferase [Alphaproteobacteria bacterium]|nr:UDP-3-O-(3-hydroxymyristoyl)glucosamine N-acyltransferase [Alphaproteobacteria bacterium]